MVFLHLTDATKGNAAGIAAADIITQQLFDQVDFGVTYSNLVASTYLEAVKIPIPMADGDAAVRLAVRTLRNRKPLAARILRIKNTLNLVDIHVSEPMCDEVAAHPSMETTGQPTAMCFT
jgi:hypothetical protein